MQTGDGCSAMRMLQRVQKIRRDHGRPEGRADTVPAVISGTNATVDSSKMSDALDKLADNGLLTVDASNSSSTGLSFTLPSADVRKLADKNVKLELITALGSVTLDAASSRASAAVCSARTRRSPESSSSPILYRYAVYKGPADDRPAPRCPPSRTRRASPAGPSTRSAGPSGSGLTNGKNGRIDPAGLTTRAEAAALLHRCLA